MSFVAFRRAVCASVVLILFQAASGRADFVSLGDLPGDSFVSTARGISADGNVVVGSSRSSLGIEAFLWTQAGGMIGLGQLPGAFPQSRALGVSGDGSVVAGFSIVGPLSSFQAFRWTAETGIKGLGATVSASAVSSDGSVIVGHGPFTTAFRWTEATGVVNIGRLPGGEPNTGAYGVSADGSVIVGGSNSSSGYQAFRWTQGGGMVALGDLPGGSFVSQANAVSADGLVVVGYATTEVGQEAFRWTQEAGMVGLGYLPSGVVPRSIAYATSADGSVVVGFSGSGLETEPFVWDSINGMRKLHDILIAQGDDVAGWRLEGAIGISADGRTIVGSGTKPERSVRRLACPPQRCRRDPRTRLVRANRSWGAGAARLRLAPTQGGSLQRRAARLT